MTSLVLAALASAALLCDRPAPSPMGFHARGFGHVAEVFPARSRRNPDDRPRAYLYGVDHPGTSWEVKATRSWTALLPHDAFPNEAVLSMEGHLVTLDDWFQIGDRHAVVVFGRDGRVLADYALDQLLSASEIQALERSDCGVHWRRDARYYFVLAGTPRLYMVLPVTTLELDLTGHGVRRGNVSSFPELAEVMSRAFPNEQAEAWPVSLRFSSITDVQGGAPGAPR